MATTTKCGSLIVWAFGELSHINWAGLMVNFAVVLPISICLYYNRWNYRAIGAGDEYARSIGVNPDRTRIAGLVLTTICTSVVVSFFGVIAFIGLVVPHMIRKFIGNNEEFLILASALTGAAFLLICDTLARTLFAPIVLPVGIITSMVGAPFFLILLLNKKKHEVLN